MLAAYRELFHALREQRRDPAWELPVPDCPDGPYVPRARSAGQAGTAQLSGPQVLAPEDGGVVDVPPAGADDDTARAKIDLGPVNTLSVGQVRRIDHEGNTYALYRLGESEFALTDGLCTHAQTHLADGHLEGCIIECPKHNGRFDVRTGEPLRRPPRMPLCTYAVEVDCGRVVGYLSPAATTVKTGSSSVTVPSGPLT